MLRKELWIGIVFLVLFLVAGAVYMLLPSGHSYFRISNFSYFSDFVFNMFAALLVRRNQY